MIGSLLRLQVVSKIISRSEVLDHCLNSTTVGPTRLTSNHLSLVEHTVYKEQITQENWIGKDLMLLVPTFYCSVVGILKK